MFCVIQEIEKKTQNKYGHPIELHSKYMSFTCNGAIDGYYYYEYGVKRFEREIRRAYRISIHHSYRECGKIKKKQFVLCTVDYYDFAENFFTIFDYADCKIEKIARQLYTTSERIYELVDSKTKPLKAQIVEEFRQTKEYLVHKEHERIIAKYKADKTAFNKKYGCSEHEYDKCYDVFGELKDSEYLEKVKEDFKFREEYEEKSRSYYRDYKNNYKNSCYSSTGSSNYNSEEKEMLKQFYRELSKKYHPDANRDTDTSKQMQVLNQLKSDWGL